MVTLHDILSSGVPLVILAISFIAYAYFDNPDDDGDYQF